jgi:hypothetical protein
VFTALIAASSSFTFCSATVDSSHFCHRNPKRVNSFLRNVYSVVVTTKSFHAHKRYAVKSVEEEGCKERVGSTLPGITVRRNCDSVFEETFSHHFLATTISGYTHIQQKIVKWQNRFRTLLVFYILMPLEYSDERETSFRSNRAGLSSVLFLLFRQRGQA